MQKQSAITNPYIYFYRIIIFFSFLLFTQQVFAQEFGKIDTASRLVVTRLAKEEDMMLISVVYEQDKPSKLKLAIYNTEGALLFRDIFNVKQFNKMFKVPTEQGRLNFVLEGMEEKVYANFHLNHITNDASEKLVVFTVN